MLDLLFTFEMSIALSFKSSLNELLEFLILTDFIKLIGFGEVSLLVKLEKGLELEHKDFVWDLLNILKPFFTAVIKALRYSDLD